MNKRILLLLLVVLFVFTSCSGLKPKPAENSSATEVMHESSPVPLQTLEDTGDPRPQATATSVSRPGYCLEDAWPFTSLDLLEQENLFCGADDRKPAKLLPGEGSIKVVYALVAPFDTVRDSVSLEEFQALWQGEALEDVVKLSLSKRTELALSSRLGKSDSSLSILDTEPETAEFSKVLKHWAVVPFTGIVPEWKVIGIDGQNPIHKEFNAQDWSLTISFGLEPTEAEADLLPFLPLTNRDSEKFATVMLTGVTALVRATAVGMEEYGVLAPAVEIGDTLRSADLLHISNKVPFKTDCPPHTTGLYYRFCSSDKYLELLSSIGTDIVELTGDHFQDYGDEAMLHTLDLYREQGWPYYGGGANIKQARQALKLEIKGNKIAFLGCNGKDPRFAYASETQSGAYHCDMDYMTAAVSELKKEGYLLIVTFQHEERYHWLPNAYMLRDFRAVAEAGATIVSGSQAHQPQTYEFIDGTFIHYGLGNLFFDQLGMGEYTDKAFLDRHYFYDGRYLGVELLTVKWTDYITPRWMRPAERAAMLEVLFLTSAQIYD